MLRAKPQSPIRENNNYDPRSPKRLRVEISTLLDNAFKLIKTDLSGAERVVEEVKSHLINATTAERLQYEFTRGEIFYAAGDVFAAYDQYARVVEASGVGAPLLKRVATRMVIIDLVHARRGAKDFSVSNLDIQVLLQEASAVKQSNPEVAFLLIEYVGQRLDEASIMDLAEYAYTRASVLYLLGRKDEAYPTFQQAVNRFESYDIGMAIHVTLKLTLIDLSNGLLVRAYERLTQITRCPEESCGHFNEAVKRLVKCAHDAGNSELVKESYTLLLDVRRYPYGSQNYKDRTREIADKFYRMGLPEVGSMIAGGYTVEHTLANQEVDRSVTRRDKFNPHRMSPLGPSRELNRLFV